MGAIWSALVLLLFGTIAYGQDSVPIISGGGAFQSTVSGGAVSLQPVIAPVLAAPLGGKFLVESRGDIREVAFKESGGRFYNTEFFGALEYLQLDYLASSAAMLTVGRYLTPFGIYNERLSPVWIRNFVHAPYIYGIGTRTTGSSDGAMLRGVVANTSKAQLSYVAYFSASSTVSQLESGRAAGARAAVLLPGHRLEVGGSYQRYLQDVHLNSVGADVSWQPYRVPLDVKAEFARSPQGRGYWVESAYRLAQHAPTSPLGRVQLLARVEQFHRTATTGVPDALPEHNATRADVGLNYYLRPDLRADATYGREFTPALDRNVWNFALTYRLPVVPIGAKKL